MQILYNTIQLILLTLLFPLWTLYILLRRKYRSWVPLRLGFGLADLLPKHPGSKPVIWMHALSVGEVTSALPLAKALHSQYDQATIIFSASTQTGYQLGKELLSPYCRAVIPFPLDILPVCHRFLRMISPGLFVLVETDFWPNFLFQLKKRNIPAILVNGRVSKQSMPNYSRYAPLFKTLFQTFSHLCVQTAEDRSRFIALGLPEDRVLNLGNLKYEPAINKTIEDKITIPKRDKFTVFIAGSTHPGEEEHILQMYSALQSHYPLKLIIAPRDIQRADMIATLAESRNISVQYRSSDSNFTCNLLILDSIGELTSVYGLGDICFVGGSLVDEGGHNPLEPAFHGKPVIFGPYMSDFDEISDDLVNAGGALIVADPQQLQAAVKRLLEEKDFRQRCGESAQQWIMSSKGVLRNHVELIRDLI